MKILPICAAAMLSFTAACTSSGYMEAVPPILELGETSTVSGHLLYRERMALPPGSTATITLQDISRAGAPATIVNEVRYGLDGSSVPFYFTIDKPNRLDSSVQLGLRATINDANGDLLFTTDSVNPVMTRPVDQDLGEIVMVSAR